MSDKWYVIKVSEENKFNKKRNYIISPYYDNLEKDIKRNKDTIISIIPSKEAAENTKRVLDEQTTRAK
ncbi:hypothetical protein LaPh949_gp042 [Lactococcus phage 949]|uniref:Uncharacterized protein n=1 Tax=Lactococcus phage 949 TaxID=881953 RepID=E0YIS9_9CAUD|nr:hypothetical protein LaPh949_gp042 [Lactococcus phage 949]ADM73600.1 hypothetical protein [Lactococcus phage 949]